MTTREVFVPFRYPEGAAPPTTSVRSTLVVSSIQTLRHLGHFEAYYRNLSPEGQHIASTALAGAWLPISAAIDHYQAIDKLTVRDAIIAAMGKQVADRANGSLLATIIRASREVGVTPWTFLGSAHRFIETNWQGGDICVHRHGPKEATIEWVAQPLASIPYFVGAYGEYIRAAVSQFCGRVYSKRMHINTGLKISRLAYQLSWA